MNIENIWQQSGGNDDALKAILMQDDFNQIESKLPLKRLKRNLIISAIWGVVITFIYFAIIYFVPIWQAHICLAVVILFNIYVVVDSLKLHKSISVDISGTNSLKQELQKNYDGFDKWWRIQEKMGLFVYPIAGAGGFMIGGVAGSGKTVEAFLYNPTMLIILLVTIIILVPICYYTARWMFKYAYGKHLAKLKLLIDELSV